MQKLHDTVVLYNSKDIHHADLLVAALKRRGVKVWFGDRDVVLGDPVGTKISDALASTRYVIVSVGPNGADGAYFKEVEFSAILQSVAAKRYSLIPVYLGQDNSYSPGEPAQELLGGPRAIDLRGGVESSEKELGRLVEQLLDRPKVAEPPEETATGEVSDDSVPEARPDLVDEIIHSIIVRLEEGDGLLVGVGPHWPGSGMPDSAEVALDLLSRTLKWNDEDKDLFRNAPLVHAEAAALPYALERKYNQDIAPDRIAREVITPRSLGEPEAFKSLARLMQAVGERGHADDGRAVVFTTNVDCALERSFMVSGVPFTLIVHSLKGRDYSNKAFIISDIPACERFGNEWRLSTKGKTIAAREMGGLTIGDEGRYREGYTTDVDLDENGTGVVNLSDYVRSMELNRMLTEFLRDTDNREETDRIVPRGTPERPVIVKLLGSHILPRTAVVSCEQHFQLAMVAQRINPIAQQLIARNAFVLAGHCICDPVFRLMFETALSECFADSSDNQDRYGLLPGTGSTALTGVAALRRVVESRVAGTTMFNMRFEQGVNPETFFQKLGERVLDITRGAWG